MNNLEFSNRLWKFREASQLRKQDNCNLGENIWNKAKKSSKIGQD